MTLCLEFDPIILEMKKNYLKPSLSSVIEIQTDSQILDASMGSRKSEIYHEDAGDRIAQNQWTTSWGN